jgi:hypothetical protein
VINYEQIHNYHGSPDLVIIDEAHATGQYPKPSERTKALKELCTDLPIIYLSGTPNPESFSQRFHQLWISSYSPYKKYSNFYKWANDFVSVKKKFLSGLSINDYSSAKRDEIEATSGHLFINFSQVDAGFIQPVEEEVLLVRMTPQIYKLADLLIKNRVYTTKSGMTILAATAAALQQKIHQIYSGTVKVEQPADMSAVVLDKSKVDFIRQHFEGKKIAIFYKFVAEAIMIRAHLGRPITESPESFNAHPGLVFIAQIQSGREGINLSTADALVFLNIDFSAVSYWQSRARLQSKDRATPAKVFYVFAENGIEQKIFEAVQAKKDYTLFYFKRDYAIREPSTNSDKSANWRKKGG